jgi:DNA processing protein
MDRSEGVPGSDRRDGRIAGELACGDCLRRCWLLGELSAVLDCHGRADGRLLELLALADGELLAALGGRRRGELEGRWASFRLDRLAAQEGVDRICRHAPGYPARLCDPPAPRLLQVRGGLERLRALCAGPVVAILGARRASDYGIELARALGRGLAASGVTVATASGGATARAAQLGALEVSGATLMPLGDGLGVAPPAAFRALLERAQATGCAISELPNEVGGRRWGAAASQRTLVGLGELSVVVEAEETPADLAGARIAQRLGRSLAAFPGRVGSHGSRGSHLLLREGATLVRDAADVLEALHEAGDRPETSAAMAGSPCPSLEPRLRVVLERVGAGLDTPGHLLEGQADAGATLRALGELELMGLLARGDGGRYVLRATLPFGR